MTEEKKQDLKELKENYKKLQEKYELPSFRELNENFQIEKIAEIETDFLTKEISKFIADKFQSYLRFIEAIINPVNTPLYILSLIKNMEEKNKKTLSEIHSKISKRYLSILELDLEYSEEKEINFIKENYEFWKEIKKELLEVLKELSNKKDKKREGNSGGYFG